MMRHKAGFSLLELLVTTGVIALGLLSLLGVLAFSAKASLSSEMASLAVSHCVHTVELIRSRNLDFADHPDLPNQFSGLNDPPHVRRELNDPPFQADFEPDLPFKRNILIERVGASDSYNHDVVNITVSVFWPENNEERSVRFVASHKRP